MKRRLSIFALFLTFSLCFAENQNLTAQMKSSYESGFYPGVIRHAEEIFRTEKDSLTLFRAAVYSGECLFKMGRVKDSVSTLQKYHLDGDSKKPETVLLNSSKFYWLGQCYFSKKEFPAALSAFFASASIFREAEKASAKMAASSFDYYSSSILYGAKCYFATKEYSKAIPLFDYVVSNSGKFSSSDYSDSLLALAQCYDFTGDYKTAHEYYKKAGKNPPSEILTRFAIDSFNEKDYEKSLSYFEQAESSSTTSEKEIAAVYKAEIAWLTADEKSESSKSEACKKAILILSEAVVTKELSKSEVINISLSRFNGYLKNWKECENYASKCISSQNDEIKKNAVYWYALSKYESGNFADSVKTIESYEKSARITEKTILSLYAKSLAKIGKYHEADKIFYSLGEKNQLDNDGRLDYSRTLLIAGHYISTKEQAAKANGDEAVYLSALASFNQHRWGEASSSFAKVTSSKTLSKDYVAYAKFYLGYSQYQLSEYSKSIATLNDFVRENPIHKFVWSAHMTVARSASFIKNDSVAISAAQNAVKTAKNETERNEALLLNAGILSDSKKYDEAIALLHPYISRQDEFGWECKHRSAEILVSKGNFKEADRYFGELSAVTDKKAEILAEESCYRRAELAYSQKEFAKSAEYFEDYSRRFGGGRFHYAAIYFSADSLAKTDDDTRAILRYLQIVDSKAETSYRYGSEKNLVDLYEKIGELDNAIAMANKMLEEYGEQAKNDGINKRIKEIKSKTVWNANSEADRIKSAETELAKKRNDASQSAVNMKNAIFLAGIYRNRGENKKSAEMYLEAAKFSRQAGNDENAARSFYGAVESFDAAGLYADSKATFNEMKKLYPESKYTRDGEKIVNQM